MALRANKDMTLDYLKLRGYYLASLPFHRSTVLYLRVNTPCWPFVHYSTSNQTTTSIIAEGCSAAGVSIRFHLVIRRRRPDAAAEGETAQQTFCAFSGRCLERPPPLAPSAPPIHAEPAAPHHTQRPVATHNHTRLPTNRPHQASRLTARHQRSILHTRTGQRFLRFHLCQPASTHLTTAAALLSQYPPILLSFYLSLQQPARRGINHHGLWIPRWRCARQAEDG